MRIEHGRRAQPVEDDGSRGLHCSVSDNKISNQHHDTSIVIDTFVAEVFSEQL